MRHTFTLDTNCLLAVSEQRDDAPHIRALVQAHRSGHVSVAIAAISASERQRNGKMLDNFSEFTDRLASLDLADLPLVLPMCYWDVMYWDACVEATPEQAELEVRIQSILFPTVPCAWPEYCKRYKLNPENSPLDKKWKNAKCDVQAFWCHAVNRHKVFVTTDKNFHRATKKPKLLALAPGSIVFPHEAARLVT